jgi:hypothetical protein
MIRPYSVFLHLEVAETLRSLRRSERDRVLRFAHLLSRDPFQSGDFQETDDRGRTNEVKILRNLALVYYSDHAGSEVRLLEVRRAGV